MQARRNVLFISADQWRFECLSAMGHPVVQTPRLDRLAGEGVLFRQHFSQTAPCGPARTSMLTGLYAMNHRSVLNGTPLSKRHTNIALEVRKLGYDPILFGYTDTSLDPSEYAPGAIDLKQAYMGVMPGFTVGVAYEQEMFLPWFSDLKSKGYELPENPFDVYLGQKNYPGAAERGSSFAPPIYSAADSDTAFTTNKVIEYLEENRDRDWFVHAVYLRPHPPLFAPEPYNSMFDPATVPFPKRLESTDAEAQQHKFLEKWMEIQTRRGYYWGHDVNVQTLEEHEIRQMIACYYGLIREVDDQVGRLLDYLESTDQLDQTLIIFTCDHGEQLGDHFLWDKGGYFDQSYHIPLIMRDPRSGSARGNQVDSFTEAVDIVPTILDWLGAPIPLECDGRSLTPFLKGTEPDSWRDSVHWEFDFRDPRSQEVEKTLGIASDECTLNVIRSKKHKYVHFTKLPPLFFDLEQDPMEFHDRSRDSEYQPLVLEYAQKLLSLRMAHAERNHANTILSPITISRYGKELAPRVAHTTTQNVMVRNSSAATLPKTVVFRKIKRSFFEPVHRTQVTMK